MLAMVMNLNPEPFSRNPRSVSQAALAVPASLGLMLLVWEFTLQASRHSLELSALILLWSIVPFGLALLMGRSLRLRVFAVGFVSAIFLTTLFGHFLYFVAPDESGSSWGLIFIPLFNLIAVGPSGGLIAWFVFRFRSG